MLMTDLSSLMNPFWMFLTSIDGSCPRLHQAQDHASCLVSHRNLGRLIRFCLRNLQWLVSQVYMVPQVYVVQ